MGNTYEVKVWESAVGSDHFYWLEIYRGEKYNQGSLQRLVV